MPQQLIYTSAPRGIVAGRSGHCTVARSASMREALMLQLEKFCYYQHLSLSGGQERPIFACRVVDIRGTRFHVLSRIQDAGLDFTGRTNFIAHHLVFTPEEIRQFPTPPVILRDWPGWVKSWTKDPQMLENEDWSGLTTPTGKTNVPAQTWQRVTGDAVNGYGLLEARAGASFRVDDQADEIILGLFAESLELLEVRDTRRDFRAAAWNYTFTTSMQEQDNPADFRWRCIHSDNPTASRFTPPDCRALSAVRATKWTGEETAFARTGRQAPRFVAEPQDDRITEGESAHFTAKAEGVPNPSYQWFSVDRANNGQVLPGETNSELVVSNPALGISRYVVNVTNSVGNVQSKVATLSVEQKLKLAQVGTDTGSRGPAKPTLYNVKSGDDIERQRRRLEAEKAQGIFQKRLRRNKILVTVLAIVLIAAAGVLAWHPWTLKKSPQKLPLASSEKQQEDNKSTITLPSVVASAETTSINQSNSSQSNALSAESKPEKVESNNNPVAFRNERFDLPNGWMQIPIGKVTNQYAEYINVNNVKSPAEFVLTAAAKGFSTNGDHFFFVYETNSGKEFTAVISKVDPPSSLNRCGIMVRESPKIDSPFLFIGESMKKIIAYRRDSKGEMFTNEIAIQTLPVLVKFEQKDNQYSATYWNSTNWSSFQDYTIPKSDQMLFGFALCSGSSSAKVTAHFAKDDGHAKKQ